MSVATPTADRDALRVSNYRHLKLYRVGMKDGSFLTVAASSEEQAGNCAAHLYYQATQKWMGVETVDVWGGYDVA